MTKEDILRMNNLQDIMKALSEHRGLWDEETDRHMQKIAKAKKKEKYGDGFVFDEISRKQR